MFYNCCNILLYHIWFISQLFISIRYLPTLYLIILVAPIRKNLYSINMFRCILVSILLGLCLFVAEVSGQEKENSNERQKETIPNILRRPEKGGEAPRFPQDLVIGEIGKGEATDEAWLFAHNLLSALAAGKTDGPAPEGTGNIITESLREEINSIEPRTYRLGSGRVEADGCISFLIRFIGSNESITGELFIRREGKQNSQAAGSSQNADLPGAKDSQESRWLLDDLILEEKRSLAEIRDSYRFDFSPYERFY